MAVVEVAYDGHVGADIFQRFDVLDAANACSDHAYGDCFIGRNSRRGRLGIQGQAAGGRPRHGLSHKLSARNAMVRHENCPLRKIFMRQELYVTGNLVMEEKRVGAERFAAVDQKLRPGESPIRGG
jgi:hypothetical protein